MTSQNGGRNSRRGGRSRPRRRSDDAPGRPQSRPSATPVKKGLWAKITSFFSAGNGASTASRRNGVHAVTSAPDEAAPVAQPARKPQSVEVTTPRLYVGNLSFDASESDLYELFKGVGEVQNAEVVTYKHNQRSKGFAFVQMLTVEEAKRAVSELHDKEFLGRKLVVSGAKANEHARS
ncbi:MAG: hypothetical protein ABI839_07095 [Verrucomicrobiota bacterium]